jgi:hypothetical protein
VWVNAAKPVHEEWIEKNEAKGIPAKAIYKEYKKLIKKYQ